jgi:Ca-activated chloride channel family protein
VPALEIPPAEVLGRVSELWQAAKKPASVMLLLDTSGSMVGEPLEKAKAGALRFIETMQPRDELEIRTFSDKIVRLAPVTKVADGAEGARQKIQDLFAGGGTHLYDVLREATIDWNERRQKHPERHYGIVLLTDGQDEGSLSSRSDLFDVLPKGDAADGVKIFTIGYGPKTQAPLLAEISGRSNARSFVGSTANVGSVYLEISANF